MDDYYPFGMEINSLVNGTKNEYLYNKKELQESLGLYDYGARLYDPVIGRFTSVDPLAENSRRWGTYNYGSDNPIRNIDPDGMESESVKMGEISIFTIRRSCRMSSISMIMAQGSIIR